MLRSTVFRFAALVFLFQVVAAVLLVSGIGALVRGQLDAEATRTLAVLRDDLAASYDADGADGLAREIAVRLDRRVTPGAVMLLVDAQGRRLAGNLDAWPPSVPAVAARRDATLYRSGHALPEPMRLAATRLRGGERLLVGTVTAGEARALRLMERATLIALPLAAIFAAAAAWAAARLIVGRLQASLSALGGVAGGDVARRVPPDPSHDAFAVLGRSVNAALDRVETLLTELRIATDGLAHDLKSPLTRMRVALERAAMAADPGAAEAIERALAEADRLFALVQTALSISRAEAGLGRESFAMVDVAAALADLVEIYAPLVEDNGRAITLAAPAACIAPVHRELFAQAIGNLVDNALKYGAGPIAVRLRAAGGGLEIEVADRGPGIPADRRAEALRRFGRLDDARGGTGAGLGLALVAAVAHLHDGTLTLDDAAPGLIARLWLPAG